MAAARLCCRPGSRYIRLNTDFPQVALRDHIGGVNRRYWLLLSSNENWFAPVAVCGFVLFRVVLGL